jgi:hypothetical protein
MTDAKSFEQFRGKQVDALVGAIIRSLNEHALLAWDRSDHDDESAGFSVDLDLTISVQPEGAGFTAAITLNPDALPVLERIADGGADVYMPEEITLPIDAVLYAEIEKAFRQRA